jgi:AraC-like DNA-binding protein
MPALLSPLELLHAPTQPTRESSGLGRHPTGSAPARLRMWQRLRAAIVSLPVKPIALAAFDAGFADQAHLTRTATQLIGQTPGDLIRTLGGLKDRRRSHRTAALTTAA